MTPSLSQICSGLGSGGRPSATPGHRLRPGVDTEVWASVDTEVWASSTAAVRSQAPVVPDIARPCRAAGGADGNADGAVAGLERGFADSAACWADRVEDPVRCRISADPGPGRASAAVTVG